MHVAICRGILYIQYTGTTGAAESLVVGRSRVNMEDEEDLQLWGCGIIRETIAMDVMEGPYTQQAL